MSRVRVQARIKLTLIFISICTYITLTTNIFSKNLIYQISALSIFIIYFILQDRDGLKNLLGIIKFLIVMILLLHSIFFLVKIIMSGRDYALNFYKERWPMIVIRIFVIPNIFAFVNIVTSRISFIDIILITKNSSKTKAIYILLISGIEVMERLRIHFEYHPLNQETKGLKQLIHYLAIPLTLFFGIYRGFENKYNTMIERENLIKELE